MAVSVALLFFSTVGVSILYCRKKKLDKQLLPLILVKAKDVVFNPPDDFPYTFFSNKVKRLHQLNCSQAHLARIQLVADCISSPRLLENKTLQLRILILRNSYFQTETDFYRSICHSHKRTMFMVMTSCYYKLLCLFGNNTVFYFQGEFYLAT